jgi:hypothetical protein
MNKILVGLILGTLLGAVDGLTAWFTPEVRKDILTIIIGSTFKGIVAGIAAGIFARKVKSTPAGIVFGLIVGLGLAYWVAAMQGKYYFEIMLPGGTVGAILGWATQRYGQPVRRSGVAVAMFVLAMLGVNAQALDHDHAAKPAENAGFEKLKALAGKQTPTMVGAGGGKTNVEYRVTAAGTTIIETMFAGEPHEMVTVYTVDGESINATHYCSGGNQPRMRLNTAKSGPNDLVFDFVSLTGKDAEGRINAVRFHFDGDKVVETWSSTTNEDYLRLAYTR